jgi:hypothetical protein
VPICTAKSLARWTYSSSTQYLFRDHGFTQTSINEIYFTLHRHWRELRVVAQISQGQRFLAISPVDGVLESLAGVNVVNSSLRVIVPTDVSVRTQVI